MPFRARPSGLRTRGCTGQRARTSYSQVRRELGSAIRGVGSLRALPRPQPVTTHMLLNAPLAPRLIGAALLSLAAACSATGSPSSAAPPSEPPPSEPPSSRPVDLPTRPVYKTVNGKELHLHVFAPDDAAPLPRAAIVFFFGGGWNSGTPAQFHPQCEYLASRGMVAMSAEYRVQSRDGTTPRECVADGRSAVRWIRTYATALGIDPNRIAAGGGSAGGHVAAAAALTEGLDEPGEAQDVSARPDALVLFNPVVDNGPGGWGHDRVQDFWQQISPLHNVGAGAPPTVVLLGTKDALIPVETGRAYKARMEAAGARCDLHLYEGQTHGFFNPTRKPNGPANFEATMEAVDAFLVSTGFLAERLGDDAP